VLQIHVYNQSNAPTTLTSLKLTASGTGNDATGISGVSLYADMNNNGVLDIGDNLLSTGSYGADNGTLTMAFTSGITAFGTANYLVVYSFSGSAGAGTYQANMAGNGDASGTNGTTGQPILVTGAPLNGAVVTLVALTATPSFTPTPTSTFTPLPTHTPTVSATKTNISAPYPNPANGPITFDILTSGLSEVKWSVFTLGFRKIVEGNVSVNDFGSIQWDLRDKKGDMVGDGLYYVRVEITGAVHYSKIWKVLVLR